MLSRPVEVDLFDYSMKGRERDACDPFSLPLKGADAEEKRGAL